MKPRNGRRPRRRRHDRGAIAGIEALPFGFLLFVAGTLFITNVWAEIDAKLAVGEAAREASRTYVEADDAGVAEINARLAAYDALDGSGRGQRPLITIDEPVLDGAFARCTRVTITVHYRVPALTIPWLGGLGRGIDTVATHSEIIDPYRNGLAAGACA